MDVVITKTDSGFFGTFVIDKIQSPYELTCIEHLPGASKVEPLGDDALTIQTCQLSGETKEQMCHTLKKIVMGVLKQNA